MIRPPYALLAAALALAACNDQSTAPTEPRSAKPSLAAITWSEPQISPEWYSVWNPCTGELVVLNEVTRTFRTATQVTGGETVVRYRLSKRSTGTGASTGESYQYTSEANYNLPQTAPKSGVLAFPVTEQIVNAAPGRPDAMVTVDLVFRWDAAGTRTGDSYENYRYSCGL